MARPNDATLFYKTNGGLTFRSLWSSGQRLDLRLDLSKGPSGLWFDNRLRSWLFGARRHTTTHDAVRRRVKLQPRSSYSRTLLNLKKRYELGLFNCRRRLPLVFLSFQQIWGLHYHLTSWGLGNNVDELLHSENFSANCKHTHQVIITVTLFFPAS